MSEIVTLKAICTEMKVNPREARERLRAAVADAKNHPDLAKTHKARAAWAWIKGSSEEKAARVVIKSSPTEKVAGTATKA